MKILCIPYTHALSHISRPLAIACELAKRGHTLVFAGESGKTSLIRQQGFPVYPLYEPDPDVLFGNIREGKLRFASDAEIKQMIEADLALFQEVMPDLVLSDGRFSAPLSTHIGDIKHAAIVNVSSTEYRALPYIPFFNWIPPSFILNNTVKNTLDHINLLIEMFVFDNAMSIFKSLSRKYDIIKTVTATNCLTGKDLTLLADVPEYFPTRNLPDNYHYVGPLTWKSSLAPPSWWPPQNFGRPLVYITMGTTGIGRFFSEVRELFIGGNMTAIITTGGQVKSMETIEGNIYSEDYIDGDLAMDASDIVVCHGGNGTIYQALQHGKPIIGIPTIPDQKFNMRRIESLGLGKTLSWERFISRPSTLPETIRAVLEEESFHRNAEAFRCLLQQHQPVNTSADLIERLLHDSP